MINRVDGNNYYVYTKQKSLEIPSEGEKFNLDLKRDEVASEGKDRTDGGLSEKAKREEQTGVKLELSSSGQFASAERQKQSEKTKEQAASEQKPLLETIQEFVVKAISAVQDFLRRIWNDQPAEGVSQESLNTEDLVLEATELMEAAGGSEAADSADSMELSASIEPLETADAVETGERQEIINITESKHIPKDGENVFPMDEESRNRMIQQSLRSGDMARVISLLTENGKRTIAKNSTLLTSYDKNGRVVESDASDRQRVLYGDRNSLKL